LHKIIEQLFQLPFVKIASLKDELGVSYPTAKADVDRLSSVGILEEIEGESPKTFVSPEIFRIAFSD
jgi:DeoR/GlpR family transcriptional regulator of sugar metabolism